MTTQAGASVLLLCRAVGLMSLNSRSAGADAPPKAPNIGGASMASPELVSMAASAPQPAVEHVLTVPVKPNGSYSVLLGGVEWLPGGATFVRHSKRTWSTHDGSLRLTTLPSTAAGTDKYGGAHNCTTLRWAAGGESFQTSVRVYAQHAVFRQTFPAGLHHGQRGFLLLLLAV